ncbi:helix-turn-helix domain-containing protein [Gryllotalpicola protaetiae]|uniref:Helix-turn-helix domain-containing protein n=1 Tax=Gryllotalpicola protaetiae TaxID=2419771 RepID=A0A387BN05_9MICO|nr:helix-turn-helix domain-containing protein [Gryllotalpicola protaetiae]AYG02386.1 hypothetical protein D7I44_01775 [Gryllotalpicola protaetiae]
MTGTLLSVGDAARRVRKDRRTIDRWIANGELPTIRICDNTGRTVIRLVQEEHLLAVWRRRLLKAKGQEDAHA